MHQNNPFTTLQLILAAKKTTANFILTEINKCMPRALWVEWKCCSWIQSILTAKNSGKYTVDRTNTHTRHILHLFHKYLYLRWIYINKYTCYDTLTLLSLCHLCCWCTQLWCKYLIQHVAMYLISRCDNFSYHVKNYIIMNYYGTLLMNRYQIINLPHYSVIACIVFPGDDVPDGCNQLAWLWPPPIYQSVHPFPFNSCGLICYCAPSCHCPSIATPTTAHINQPTPAAF